jgi:hypothetical protein
MEMRVQQLEQELSCAMNCINELEGASDVQWQQGYHHGHVKGFENALQYTPCLNATA